MKVRLTEKDWELVLDALGTTITNYEQMAYYHGSEKHRWLTHITEKIEQEIITQLERQGYYYEDSGS